VPCLVSIPRGVLSSRPIFPNFALGMRCEGFVIGGKALVHVAQW
jgi:hypothetical protein